VAVTAAPTVPEWATPEPTLSPAFVPEMTDPDAAPVKTTERAK